jgi:hypothetical protein
MAQASRVIVGDGIHMEVIMAMQSENKGHGLASKVSVQMITLAVVGVIVIAVAWKYVW